MALGARERLSNVGALALSDAELLALLLGTGTQNEPVRVLAERLLHDIGGLHALERQGLSGLLELRGLGEGKAARILAAFELGRRAMTRPLSRRAAITSSAAVDAALRPTLGVSENESFIAIPLDVRHRPMGEITLATGGRTSCPVAPADVFRALLREGAVAAIFVHNHPSGDPTPSADDFAITARLKAAGEILGIAVLDHVIVARDGYFSFLDSGAFGTAKTRRKKGPSLATALEASSAILDSPHLACFSPRPSLGDTP